MEHHWSTPPSRTARERGRRHPQQLAKNDDIDQVCVMRLLHSCVLAVGLLVACGGSDSTNVTCGPGELKSGDKCVNVAGTLDGLRWEMPCTGDDPGDPVNVCQTVKPADQTATLGGSPSVTYEVTLRFRGVVEEKGYVDGTKQDHWQIGGTPVSGPFNVYELDVSEPAQSYYVNSGVSGIMNSFPLDYQATIEVKGGAKVTLSADPIDTGEIKNHDEVGAPIVIPDVPPAPKSFDGQFVQMDVVSVLAKK
jgi:hypothetical protein